VFLQIIVECQLKALVELSKTGRVSVVGSRGADVVECMTQDIDGIQSPSKFDRLHAPGDTAHDIASRHIEL
jgi:hypothetical protein